MTVLNVTNSPSDADESTTTLSFDVCYSTDPPQFYMYIAILLGSLAITGNGLVISANAFKLVKRNSTNFIITNLAVVDFMTGIAIIVLKAIPRFPFPNNKVIASWFCRIYCSDYPLWVFLNASIFNLLLVTLDRYLSVVRPIYYKQKFNQRSVLALYTLSTWLLGIITCCYTAVSWIDDGDKCVIDFSVAVWLTLWGGCWSLFGLLVFPTLVMLVAYAHVSFVLYKMPQSSQGKRAQKKVTISCFVVLSVFFICWFPDQMFFFFYSLQLPSLNLSLESPVYYVVLYLGFANSAVNPILYAFLNPNYSRALKSTLQKVQTSFSTACS